MLHVALANIKTYARRYIAVILAVAIGTAFLAATLAVNTSTTATLKNSLGDTYKNADLVAFPELNSGTDDSEPKSMTMDTVDAVRKLSGVSTAFAAAYNAGEVHTADNGYTVLTSPVSAEQNLGGLELLEGRAPLASNEVILDDQHAKNMKVSIGDTVALNAEGSKAQNLNVVGIQRTTTNPQLSGYAIMGMQEAAWKNFAGKDFAVSTIVINTKGDAAAAQKQLKSFFTDQKLTDIQVMTADEKVIQDVASMTDGNDQLTIVLLVFALIALVVTGLVVVNTFNVVIAQRTRELALLRTLGAKRKQIRTSVLTEALLIGIIASVLGVVLAVALLAGLVQALHAFVPAMSYAALALSTSGLVIPVVVGILMTIIAASLPARRAMKLAPLAALRPFDAASVKNRAGKVRIIFGALLALIGAVLLGYGAYKGELITAFIGGLFSFPGVLMLASLFVPKSVYGIGKLVAGRSVSGKLAALNAVRNPGRTTATATALLIGVTLVSMIMVGGQTAKASLNNSIAGEFPVDIQVSLMSQKPNDAALEKLSSELKALNGVEETTTFRSAIVDVKTAGEPTNQNRILAVDPQGFKNVALDSKIVPNDGEVISVSGIVKPGTKTMTLGGQEVKVVESKASIYTDLVSLKTLESMKIAEPSESFAGLMLKVDDNLSSGEITNLISEITNIAKVDSYMVDGGIVQNAMFSQVIDVLLTIVSALLAVAVLIALIGVANTLSLSVLERTRENSLLRALGLKKKQLRAMLAQEAVLIGGVAALLGLILGVAYGLLGAQSALSSMGDMSYEIPWLQLAIVLVVSIVAALLASVTPGRRASKLSPVEGLAAE